MPMKRDDEPKLARAATASATSSQQSSVDPYATGELTPRCIKCDAVVSLVNCGQKSPCSSCGFPYPLGDCSDLAEN